MIDDTERFLIEQIEAGNYDSDDELVRLASMLSMEALELLRGGVVKKLADLRLTLRANEIDILRLLRRVTMPGTTDAFFVDGQPLTKGETITSAHLAPTSDFPGANRP
jgi:hypothetical protein